MDEARVRSPAGSLAGLRVLVTRPRHQAAGLAARIEGLGGTALRFPVIDILPAAEPERAALAMQSLEASGVAIFVSPNAVEHGLALLGRAPSRLPRIVAVGESTAAALEGAGLGPVLRPESGSTSEALLALPELAEQAIADTAVLIVRGVGGRELLGETLSKRGARVTYAEVYRRARPQAPGLPPEAAGAHAVVVTSAEGLDNLLALAGEAAGRLREAGFVVASERIARHARDLGVTNEPVVAAGAGDAELLDALLRWRADQSRAGD